METYGRKQLDLWNLVRQIDYSMQLVINNGIASSLNTFSYLWCLIMITRMIIIFGVIISGDYTTAHPIPTTLAVKTSQIYLHYSIITKFVKPIYLFQGMCE